MRECTMERSDKYKVNVDGKTGLITHKEDESVFGVEMPYAMKLFIQEMQGMNIAPRLIMDEQHENQDVFEHIENNFKL